MTLNFQKTTTETNGSKVTWVLPHAGSKHYGNVPERALAARVIRAIAKEGKQLKKAREGTRAFQELGRYYLVDLNLKTIIASNINLEAWAKELGLMQDWEVMAEPDEKQAS